MRIILLLSLFISTIYVRCQSDDSLTKILIGKWTAVKITDTIDGKDTSIKSDKRVYTLEFKSDGTFIENFDSKNPKAGYLIGQWKADSKQNKIIYWNRKHVPLIPDCSWSDNHFEILKLTPSEFVTLEHTEGTTGRITFKKSLKGVKRRGVKR